MTTKPLYPVVFTIVPEAPFLSRPVYQLPFPHRWRAALQQLQSERNEREGEPNTVATRSLNAAIEMFVTYLMAPPYPVRLQAENGEEQESLWLVAREQLDTNTIWPIFLAWLEKTYQDCLSYADLRVTFQPTDLRWQSSDLTFP